MSARGHVPAEMSGTSFVPTDVRRGIPVSYSAGTRIPIEASESRRGRQVSCDAELGTAGVGEFGEGVTVPELGPGEHRIGHRVIPS